MPRLGAHMSIGGGLPCAVDRAEAAGCEALQIFTKSAGQWRARPLSAGEVLRFRRRVAETGIRPVVAHTSYLINLAASDAALRAQSMAALGEEIDRAEMLGLMGLVMHPGAYTRGSADDGLRLIAEGLGELVASRPGRTLLLLEHTAGQGTSLGHRFEHLAEIIHRAGPAAARLGVCLDTCHLVAAGYDIVSDEGYDQTMRDLQKIVGLGRVKVVHLNDSKRPCGSRVDRHEHIGKGCLGLPTFRRLLNDRRFSRMPMLLETPKSDEPRHKRLPVDPCDAMNLRTLRSLMPQGKGRRS